MGTAENNKAVQRRIIDELINQKNLDLATNCSPKGTSFAPKRPESVAVPRG